MWLSFRLAVATCSFTFIQLLVLTHIPAQQRQIFKEISETLRAGSVLTRNGKQVVICPVSCTLFLESGSYKERVLLRNEIFETGEHVCQSLVNLTV